MAVPVAVSLVLQRSFVRGLLAGSVKGWGREPAGRTDAHAPAGDGPCLFVTIFHGPSDVEPLEP